MDLVIFCLATFGLSLLVKEMEGPFGIISKWRNLMLRLPIIGVQFFKLMDCYFCTGIWAAAAIFLIRIGCDKLIADAVCWVLAGGTICLIIDAILSRLHRE